MTKEKGGAGAEQPPGSKINDILAQILSESQCITIKQDIPTIAQIKAFGRQHFKLVSLPEDGRLVLSVIIMFFPRGNNIVCVLDESFKLKAELVEALYVYKALWQHINQMTEGALTDGSHADWTLQLVFMNASQFQHPRPLPASVELGITPPVAGPPNITDFERQLARNASPQKRLFLLELLMTIAEQPDRMAQNGFETLRLTFGEDSGVSGWSMMQRVLDWLSIGRNAFWADDMLVWAERQQGWHSSARAQGQNRELRRRYRYKTPALPRDNIYALMLGEMQPAANRLKSNHYMRDKLAKNYVAALVTEQFLQGVVLPLLAKKQGRPVEALAVQMRKLTEPWQTLYALTAPLVMQGRISGLRSLVKDIEGHIQAEKDLLNWPTALKLAGVLTRYQVSDVALKEYALYLEEHHQAEVNDLIDEYECL